MVKAQAAHAHRPDQGIAGAAAELAGNVNPEKGMPLARQAAMVNP
jgi:hypothetical protein